MTKDNTQLIELRDRITAMIEENCRPVPAPLEVGKWYTGNTSPCDLATFRTGDKGNYGFSLGEWRTDINIIHSEYWHLSTASELLPLFIAEAKRLGIVPGVRITREWKSAYPTVFVPNSNESYSFSIEHNTLSLNSTIVYQDGQWAIVLPNTVYLEAKHYTKEQLQQEVDKL